MKQCKVCGKTYTPSKFARKNTMYCGQKCRRYAQHHNKLEYNRDRNKRWYQEHRDSELQKNREYRKQNKELFDWYHNKTRFEGIRDSIIKRDKQKCRVCLTKERLSIHHIDGRNHEKESPNNKPENLITLCVSCHHKLHWWQRKNHNLTTGEDIVRTMAKVIEAGSKSLR